MTVLELARSADVTPAAVRFYVRTGALGRPHALADGRRGYDVHDAQLLRALVTGHRLGLPGAATLAATRSTSSRADAIREMAAAIDRRRSAIARSRARLAELDARLAGLQAILAGEMRTGQQ